MTDTLLVALQEARAACDDHDYDGALGWLDEIEAELDGRPLLPAVEDRERLAAWNAWAAQ